MPDFGIGEIIALLGSGLSGVGATGIGGALSGFGAALPGEIASGLGGLGIGAGTAADIGAGVNAALGGAGVGAATSAITGGNPLTGAELGGLTGGVLGGAGAALGGGPTGATVAPAVGGGGTSAAASGLAGGGATGAVDLTGAASGLPSGAFGLTQPLTGLSTSPITPTAAGGATAPVTGATATAQAATTPTDFGGALSSGNLGSWVGNQLGFGQTGSALLNKFGGPLVQGGIMAYEQGAQQNQLNSLLGPLQASAELQSKQSAALESAMFGGQLPPGAQAAVDQATTAAKARVRSTYAGLGLSGSTMEADALNQVDTQAAAQKFQFAQQLLTAGMNAAQMSDQLYAGIMQTQLQEDQALSNAITNFAGSLLGTQSPLSGHTITLNVGG